MQQDNDSLGEFPAPVFQPWNASESELNARLEQYVFKHPSTLYRAGDGLFFKRDIAAKTVIGYYEGEVFDDNTPKQHAKIEKLNQDYLARANLGTTKKPKYIVVDASNVAKSNLLRYANDSRDDRTNLEFFVYKNQKNRRIYAATTKDVKTADEAFVAYGAEYWEDKLRRASPSKNSILSLSLRSKSPSRSASRSPSRSASRSAEASEASQRTEVSIPKFVKTKGFISIPTYANRKLLIPNGCPTWETLCTQDNQYMVKQKGQCKCIMYQNGDDTACSHRQRDTGGCNPFSSHDGDEVKKNGTPYAGKDLRMTFIPLERDGMPTVPACGCYKDDIQKQQARDRKRLARERKKG